MGRKRSYSTSSKSSSSKKRRSSRDDSDHRRAKTRFRKSRSFRRYVRPEIKTLDKGLGGRFDSSSAETNTQTFLSSVDTGTSAIQRIGKSIACKSVHLRCKVTAASATTLTKCALILFWWNAPNRPVSNPTWPSILNAQNSNALTNRDYASEYKILRRWEFTIVGNSTSPATEKVFYLIDELIDLKGREILWDQANTDGAFTSVIKGGLWLGCLGDAAYGATVTPLLSGNTRLYFEDV